VQSLENRLIFLYLMDPPRAEFKIVAELPKTKRNLEQQALKEANERLREEAQRQEQKLSEEHQQRLRQEEYERNKYKMDMEKKKKEEERRRREEEQQRSTLEGRLAKLISDLNANATGFETTLAGIDMGPARWRILAKALETNTSLKELHISRKGVNDEDGEELLKSLKKNFTIEKLEFQGNNMGKATARYVGELLEINDTLKYLDLEGNDLFDKDLKDKSGIVSIAEGIKKNRCLIALNLSNCGLDNDCGIILAEAMRENNIIVDFDYRGNDFSLEIIREINESLRRNKEIYDQERLLEWNERKYARKEDEYNEMINMTLQGEHMKKMSK